MSQQDVCVIQITDTHILDNEAESFDDFDTSASLERVIAYMKANEDDVDLVLLTGDCVHEPTETAYEKLAGHLEQLSWPIYFLPGNHDEPELMDAILSQHGYCIDKRILTDSWQIMLLDTRLKNEHKGELSSQQLDFLRDSLEQNTDKNTLIALHHHPVPINSRWMDQMILTNREAFLAIIDRHPQVKGVIWGHIHQQFERKWKQVKMMGTPSTCLQFTPENDEFAVDTKPPGYRRLRLNNAGEIRSDVIYLNQ